MNPELIAKLITEDITINNGLTRSAEIKRSNRLHEDVGRVLSDPYLYHVTDKSKINDILTNGLIPQYKGVVFFAYGGLDVAKEWAVGLANKIKNPVILKFHINDLFPFSMRDFEYATPRQIWGNDPEHSRLDPIYYDKPTTWPKHGSKGGKQGLVQINDINDFKIWLEILEAHDIDIHNHLDYEHLEVMVNRVIPASIVAKAEIIS